MRHAVSCDAATAVSTRLARGVFHMRFPRSLGPICETEEPPLAEVEPEHVMRCHISIDELRRLQATAPSAARPTVDV